jgi:predicted DNA-binding transcriptional regulator YafY
MAEIKLKCLRILEILKETDENNPLTTAGIQNKLALYQLAADRKAINRDIRALKEAGYDIRLCRDNKKGYYLATREFENWELKILMDAIASSKFLTDDDIAQLNAKLRGMASTESGKLLVRVTPVNNRVRQDNPAVKTFIEQFLQAIRQRQKVSFQYTVTNRNMKKELRKDGYVYVVNPYALTWKDEHYYLIGNMDKYDNLGYFRLDRMVNLALLPEPVKDPTLILGANPAQRIDEYVASAVYCHTGEKINLRLFCQYGMEDEISDYFGTGLFHLNQEGGFECHIRLMNSQGLIYWLMQHGEKVRVLEPACVKTELIKTLEATLAQYRR